MTGDRVPAQIGRYKIVDEVGRGGFGKVYRAFDPSVGRPVAIKVLTERSRDVLTRFQNEATVAGNLRHENIVTVYEYGEFEGQPYLVMEYLEGEDLHHIISSRKPLTVLEKCRIMWQVAEGLDCAHRKGVVHRDVKPANIMVQRDGVVKIMDFGIARVTRDTGATRLTQQGYVLGTLFYMAPEQFAGAEIDPLCDLFAYGVIYYELLTGRHPFESADSRALMYKISFEDPPPIRDFASDCPESLQAVVSKTLQKDRELRYQSLKDVQFDVGPIRHELQRARAAALITQAQELFDKKQLDPAQTVLLEALDLDPANALARSLKDGLQRQLQQRTLQPKIESLLATAEEQLRQRRFGEAIQSFEAALRLDRDSGYIQSRLDQARALQEHSRVAASLLSAARADLTAHNYTGAYRSVSEALRHDPQNPEATELLNHIQREVERMQREQRIEDAVHKAEGLILLRSFAEAAALLDSLAEDARDPRVERLRESIEKEKREQERRRRLQSEMAAATELLRSHKLAEAAERLEALRPDFPEHNDLLELLAYAQKEIEAARRAKAVEEVIARAGALTAANDFDGAMATLEEALRTLPGENALIRLLGSTMAAKSEWERRQAVDATLRDCEQLRAQRRFAEAIELVESTLREYSAEPALADLHGQLEKEWAQHRRAEAVRKAVEQGRKRLAEGRPAEALQFVRQSLVQYPGEPSLSDLLQEAQQEVLTQEKAQALQGVLREAALHESARDFDRALAAIEQGVRAWGGDGPLGAERERLQNAKAEWEKQRAVRAAVDSARQLSSRKQFDEAQRVIQSALRSYPDVPELTEALAQAARDAEEQKRKDAILGISSEVRLLVSRGRLDEALETVREASLKFPGDPDLEAVDQQVQQALEARQRTQAIERLLRQSEEFAASRQYDRARALIERGLASYPKEPALEHQLNGIKAAAAAWQRELAVQEIVSDARKLAKDGRFDTALQLLATSPVYSPSLLDAQRELEKGREQHERRDAIAKAAAGVTSMLDRGRVDEAIKVLRELSKQYAGEPEWPPLMSRAQAQLDARKLAEERRRAIQLALKSAEDLAGQSRHEAALQVLEECLQKFPREAALVEMQQRIRLALEARRRAEEVGAIARDAGQRIEKGEFEEAIRSLREACVRYSGEAALSTQLTQAEQKLEARERRRQAFAEAEGMLGEGRLEEGVGLLRQLVQRYPGDTAIASLLSRAQSELELKQKQAAIEKAAQDAAALLKSNDFDGAISVLDRALQAWPGEKRLVEARDAARKAQAVWQREQARSAAAQALRNMIRDGRVAEALGQSESLLREYPGDLELVEIQTELRMRAVLAQAQAMLEKGNPADAVRALEAVAGEFSANPEWVAMMERANAEVLARARAAALERKRKEARAKLEAGDIDAAAQVLDEALRRWPDDKSLAETRQAVLTAKTQRDRQETIRNAVSQCERMEREGKLPAALQYVEKFLHQFREEPSLAAIRERIQKSLEEQERRRARQRDLKDLKDLEDSAVGGCPAEQVPELLEMARRIAARRPGDQEIAASATQTITYLDDILKASRELEAGNLDAALDICSRRLSDSPGQANFKQLRDEADRRRKMAYLADLQRSAAAENDLAARARLLEEAAGRYPDDQWIANELLFTRNKLGLVESIVERARAGEAAGDWDRALEQWNRLRTIHHSQPGLEDEIRRVQEARDRARAAIETRWTSLIDEQIQAGELGKARDLLRQALSEIPDAVSLQDLGRKIDSLRQRSKQVRELLKQAQAAAENGRFDECRDRLRQAGSLCAQDPALRRQVLARLAELAEAAMETDWRQADALASDAAALDSAFRLPEALLAALAAHKRSDLVAVIIADVVRLRDSGDLRGAIAAADRGLREAPDDRELASLRQELASRIAELRNSVVGQLRDIVAEARQAAGEPELQPLQLRASTIADEVRDDAELAAQASQTMREIAACAKKLRSAQRKQWLVSRGAVLARHRKLLAGVAAAIAVAAAAVAVVPRLFVHHDVILRVRTTPPGAVVTVGKTSCSDPDCRFRIPAGKHKVTAVMDGYQPFEISDNFVPGERVLNVPLTPLPLTVQVSTNFTAGRVSIDGRRAGDLRNTELIIENVPYGSHTIAVSSPEGESRVSFDAAPGRVPSVTSRPVAEKAEAVALTYLGRGGRLSCSCQDQPVQLDRKPIGALGAGGLKIDDLAPGTRELNVGEHAYIVDVRPEPGLTLLLRSESADTGTLTVETNAPGARISIDGRPVGTTSGRGLLRQSLPSGTHRIEASRAGYRSAAPQMAEVRTGNQSRVSFTLEVLRAQLVVSGAQSGTSVSVAGGAAHAIDSRGSLTIDDVEPGERQVLLSADGYDSKTLVLKFEAGLSTELKPPQVVLQPNQQTRQRVAWDGIDKTNPAALQRYLQQYPNSSQAGEAKKRLADLERAAEEQRKTEADRREETEWANVDKSSRSALETYLQRTSAKHADDARRELDRVSQAEKSAAAKKQQLLQEELQRKEAAKIAQQQSDEQSILGTLKGYSDAYRAKSIDQLRKVFPSAPNTFASMKDFSNITVTFTGVGPPKIEGDRATLTCNYQMDLKTPNGDQHVKPRSMTLQFARQGSTWVITSTQ